MRNRFLAAGLVATAVLIAAGCGSSGGTSGTGGNTSSSSSIKTAKIGGATVLTNSKGFTLYWFAPDSRAASRCTGQCAAYWPPVTGDPQAGRGIPGTFGTIRRPGGGRQVTYDGHPLYTYVGDKRPGQANGNDLDLNGGLWYEMRVSG